MRNGHIVLNLIIYYFILNILSSPIIFGYIHFYEKYALYENDIIKILTIGVIIIWYLLLHVITYLSAKLSSYHDEGIEDAILGAFSELIIYAKLAFPFLDREKINK